MDTQPSRPDPWSVTLGSLPTEDFVVVDGMTPIREAAARMTAGRASAALIRRDGGWSIVTDRDLRVRGVAEGGDLEGPVSSIATHPAVSLPPEATASEALALMLERGIHHVPVISGERLLALVTDRDLLALERRTAVRLRREIGEAPTVEALTEAGRRAPGMLADLVVSSMDPLAVGHAAGVLHDALVIRAIDLTIARIGPPPCPWAWLALGSQARHEQAIATDQDHGLIYDPGGLDADEVDRYFEALATGVTQVVGEAGIPPCRAGVMASHRDWRGTPAEWRERFERWAGDMDPMAAGFAAVIFDHRQVAGGLDASAAIGEAAALIGRRPAMQRRLARWATDAKPMRVLLKRGAVLDIKRDGVAPITSLARVLAAMSGATSNRTIERLRSAVAAGNLQANDAAALEEAFRLLWRIRLDHQAAQVHAGVAPDEAVDLDVLGPLRRKALREAFRAVEVGRQVVRLELDIRR